MKIMKKGVLMDKSLGKNPVQRLTVGYKEFSRKATRLIDVILSFFLLVMAIPIVFILTPFIYIFNGLPLFYSGRRMGKNKQIFIMYKLRTLPPSFEKDVGSRLVNYMDGRQLPWFSRFLRDSRLDELPQLINILKGDMTFFGPRPERPEVYERMCRNILDYDKRFAVRPGLIGYSQLFTPHSCPKRIRTLIDNRALHYESKILFNICLILMTILTVLVKIVKLLVHVSLNKIILPKILGYETDKRILDRVSVSNGKAYYCNPDVPPSEGAISYDPTPLGRLREMNEEYLRLDTRLDLELRFNGKSGRVKLVCGHKSAVCNVTIFKTEKQTSILKYKPVSELNAYFIDQYFLKKSMVKC